MKQKLTAVLASVVAGATINTQEAGLLPGMQVIADIFAPAGAFSGSAKWQTSVDGSTWTDAGSAYTTTTGGFVPQNITLAQYIRLNCTAFTSGSVQGRILSNID